MGLTKQINFKKSLSNSKLHQDNFCAEKISSNTNLNDSNLGFETNIPDGNSHIEEATKITSGVIFSKVSRLNDKSKHLGKIIEDYQSNHDEKSKK